MPRWPLAALALLLLLPLSTAQTASLASLEEPHKGTDQAWEIVVSQDESNADRVLVYRNNVGNGFGLVVYDAKGETVFEKNGSRGVQTLPGLPQGVYRFFVRGDGEFQVTDKAFEKIIKENVSTTLQGTDAYVLAPTKHYEVSFTGDVKVEWLSLVGAPEEIVPPVSRTASLGGAYVMTVRGTNGAPYTIALTPTDAPATPPASTPGAGAVAALAACALVALALRRRA